MTRPNRTIEKRITQLGMPSAVTIDDARRTVRLLRELVRDVRRLLAGRGIVFQAGFLQRECLAYLELARSWAVGERFEHMPHWVAHALTHGDARQLRGVCCQCGCKDKMACTGGCSWANLSHTLCSRCIARPVRIAKRKRAAA